VSPMYFRYFNIGNTKYGKDFVVPLIGMAISVCGLCLEALADRQKSEQKKKNPNMVATEGLYRIVRCPNYLGEIVFWIGVFVSGVTALRNWMQWAFAIVALIAIVYIMFNGAQRLEKRQMARYGNDPAYRRYADSTPILLPLVPLYHLNKPEQSKE